MDGKKLQWEKVSGMVNSLEFDKAKQIIDSPKPLASYGLDKPRMEVVFKQGTSELGRISFGSDSQNPEGVYVKSSDSPTVKIAGKDVYDKFNIKLEDLLEPATSPEKK